MGGTHYKAVMDKREAKKIIRDLCYPESITEWAIDAINNATTESEVVRVLTDARHKNDELDSRRKHTP